MSGAIVVDSRLQLGDAAAAVRSVVDGLTIVAVGGDQSTFSAATVVEPDRVVVLEADGLATASVEALAVMLGELCGRHAIELLVLPATVRWREVAARLAVHLDASCVTDVLALRRGDDGVLLAERLLYGGLAVATIALQRRRAIVTMACPRLAGDGEGAVAGPGVVVERESVVLAISRAELLERTPIEQTADLTRARRIVATGRGLRSRDDLRLIDDLAAALDAEVACSRPLAEDLRWLPQERQVGLTGSTVKPELYLAVGISGQIQHLVGMRDSGVIVAINTNASAPIFGVVDVGVVGDLYQVVPRLSAALTARQRTSS